MIALSDIRDWLETLEARADSYHVGRLDSKEEKSIGVYQLRANASSAIAYGGLKCTKTVEKNVSILIHWNKNYRETEAFSQQLYDELQVAKGVVINGHKVNYIQLLNSEPVDVDKGDDQVYERVIEAKIYYERQVN